MRNMSFALTTPQMYARQKTVTRRLGWWFLKPGDLICAVRKSQGLKKGEKVQRICVIRIIKTNPEALWRIDKADVRREGFVSMSRREFIAMFCEHNGCAPYTRVNRIAFEFLSASTVQRFIDSTSPQ
jgi:hypothetical protein